MNQEDWQARTRQLSGQIAAITGRDLRLWLFAFVVVLVLAAGVLLLGFSNLLWAGAPRSALELASGLVAVIGIFTGYVLYKRHNYTRARGELIREIIYREKLQSLSLIDLLTQTFNICYLDQVLPREINRANRQGNTITFRTACAQARQWQDQDLPPLPIAVNVSAVQFRQERFIEMVRRALDQSGLVPHYLELELTESLLLSKGEATLSVLQQLGKMGLRLSIDDFGTGYSSLSYLRHFPVYKLKIDRSFVRAATVNVDDAAIITTIINMAKSLNLKVIAEGVEKSRSFSCANATVTRRRATILAGPGGRRSCREDAESLVLARLVTTAQPAHVTMPGGSGGT